MGLGEDIKAQVKSVREKLGTDCTIDSVSIGKCGYEDLTPSQTQGVLGSDYMDEISSPWAMIECDPDTDVVEGTLITVTATGKDWIVRRVLNAQAAGVLIGKRCLCYGKLV